MLFQHFPYFSVTDLKCNNHVLTVFSPMLGLMFRPRSLAYQSSFPLSLSPSVCTLPLLFHPQTSLRNSFFSLLHTRREVLEVVASEGVQMSSL